MADDDIVTRLRHKQRLREPWDMRKEPIFGEAADEIERLRGLIAEWDEAFQWACWDDETGDDCEATRDRLDAAQDALREEARRG